MNLRVKNSSSHPGPAPLGVLASIRGRSLCMMQHWGNKIKDWAEHQDGPKAFKKSPHQLDSNCAITAHLYERTNYGDKNLAFFFFKSVTWIQSSESPRGIFIWWNIYFKRKISMSSKWEPSSCELASGLIMWRQEYWNKQMQRHWDYFIYLTSFAPPTFLTAPPAVSQTRWSDDLEELTPIMWNPMKRKNSEQEQRQLIEKRRRVKTRDLQNLFYYTQITIRDVECTGRYDVEWAEVYVHQLLHRLKQQLTISRGHIMLLFQWFWGINKISKTRFDKYTTGIQYKTMFSTMSLLLSLNQLVLLHVPL